MKRQNADDKDDAAFRLWYLNRRCTRAEFDAGVANIWNQNWTTGERLEVEEK